MTQIYVITPLVLYVAERVWRLIRNVAFKVRLVYLLFAKSLMAQRRATLSCTSVCIDKVYPGHNLKLDSQVQQPVFSVASVFFDTSNMFLTRCWAGAAAAANAVRLQSVAAVCHDPPEPCPSFYPGRPAGCGAAARQELPRRRRHSAAHAEAARLQLPPRHVHVRQRAQHLRHGGWPLQGFSVNLDPNPCRVVNLLGIAVMVSPLPRCHPAGSSLQWRLDHVEQPNHQV